MGENKMINGLKDLIDVMEIMYSDKIICADKIIGIPDDILNEQTGDNPFKIYQRIKVKDNQHILILINHSLNYYKYVNDIKNDSDVYNEIEDIKQSLLDMFHDDENIYDIESEFDRDNFKLNRFCRNEVRGEKSDIKRKSNIAYQFNMYEYEYITHNDIYEYLYKELSINEIKKELNNKNIIAYW